MCMSVLPTCMNLHHACLGPTEVERAHRIPWSWNYGWLEATMWVLKSSPSPMQGKKILLAAKPSLQSPGFLFLKNHTSFNTILPVNVFELMPKESFNCKLGSLVLVGT